MSYYDPDELANHKKRVVSAGGMTQDGLTPAQRQYKAQIAGMYQHTDPQFQAGLQQQRSQQQGAQLATNARLTQRQPDTRVSDYNTWRQNQGMAAVQARDGAWMANAQAQKAAQRPPAIQAMPQPMPQARQPVPAAPATQPKGGFGAKFEGQPNVAPQPQQQPQHALGQRQQEMAALQQAHAATGQAMQNEGLAQYHGAIKAANQAIADEMQSRVDQAREWDKMQHEENLAAMSHQADMEKLGAERDMQNQMLARRDARNNALMAAAGFGQKLVNGKPVNPFDSIRSSLLG